MGFLSDLFSGGGKSQVVGYDYYFGIHMGICRGPVDAIVEIKVGDRIVYPITESKLAEQAAEILVQSEPLIVLPTNALGGLIIPDTMIVGPGDTMAVGLPYGYANPPFVPGQQLQMTGFVRLIHQNGMDPTPIDVSGDYLMAPRDIHGIEYSDHIWIYIPQAAALDWGSYANNTIAPMPPPEASINAYQWAGSPEAIPPPPPPASGLNPITINKNVLIDAYDVFGGRDGEGGILGWLTSSLGFNNQSTIWGLWKMLGEPVDLSAYRGMCTVFFDGIVAAMNPYPKPWAFRVRRILQGWDSAVWHSELALIVMTRPTGDADKTLATEIHAMNPAHIIYEVLTNREWGRGLSASVLDEPTFLATAQTLFDEGFGLCLRWARRDSIAEFLQSVLDHIGGVMYEDRTTAKIKLELIRGGYNFDALPFFDAESGLLAVTEGSVAANPALINEIEVSYRDPLSGQEGAVRVHNLASLQASGGQFNSLKKEYPGIPTAALARRVAQRDLKANGVGLRRFTLTCDRRAWNVTPGSIIKIQDLSRGILPLALRVGPTKDGTLTDGRITINAVQDVFALPATSYLGEQPSGWSPPNKNPCIGRHKVFELPYLLLAKDLSPGALAALVPTAGRVAVVLEQGQPMNTNYAIAARAGASTPDDVPVSNGYYCGYVPPEI